jgi:hypothetical protein
VTDVHRGICLDGTDDCSVQCLVLGVLLVVCCILNPSGNPTSKSDVELNQVSVGGTQHLLFGLSTGLLFIFIKIDNKFLELLVVLEAQLQIHVSTVFALTLEFPVRLQN